jgi:hypothetical protein
LGKQLLRGWKFRSKSGFEEFEDEEDVPVTYAGLNPPKLPQPMGASHLTSNSSFNDKDNPSAQIVPQIIDSYYAQNTQNASLVLTSLETILFIDGASAVFAVLI